MPMNEAIMEMRMMSRELLAWNIAGILAGVLIGSCGGGAGRVAVSALQLVR